jgi:hypothetical protein
VFAGSSQAALPRPDDRGLARGAGVAMPVLIGRAVERQARVASSPDVVERAVARYLARGARSAGPVPSEGGPDWTTAGIGASTASLLVLVAAGGFVGARRFRTRSVDTA